jgi:hypothetical protein
MSIAFRGQDPPDGATKRIAVFDGDGVGLYWADDEDEIICTGPDDIPIEIPWPGDWPEFITKDFVEYIIA